MASQDGREANEFAFAVDGAGPVSALWRRPASAQACYVLAHGAGAGMSHPFLEAVSAGLSDRGVATLRYQFPFMEAGSKRPDKPMVAHATVRAAVAAARRLAPDLPVVAGGKSFGGRMTSQAQASRLLPEVNGLAFLGFPLHPSGRPSAERGRHLREVTVPMLFLQGTRDALAELDLLLPLCADLGSRATVQLIEAADHAFTVPARSGKSTASARAELLEALVEWFETVVLLGRTCLRGSPDRTLTELSPSTVETNHG